MTIDTIKAMSNQELVALYKLMAQVDHYDPTATPATVKNLRDAGINTSDLEVMVLERMLGG